MDPATHSAFYAYRIEETSQVIRCLRAGDSCSIVGASGTGKSNLFRHLMEPQTRQHFLGDSWQDLLFVSLDSHALGELTEEAIYELLLQSLASEALDRDLPDITANQVEALQKQAVFTPTIQARQQAVFQAVAAVLSRDRSRHLILLFDQFDEVCESANPRFFANLRAIRDEHKYRVGYVVFTRDILPHLCEAPEFEEFYELFSSNVIGLRPYNHADSWLLLQRVAGRYRVTPDSAVGERLIVLTGGHPGLLKAAWMSTYRSGTDLPDARGEAIRMLLASADVHTECLKLWQSIGADERDALSAMAAEYELRESEQETLDLLQLKGLVGEREPGLLVVFCDLFETFVTSAVPARSREFIFDNVSGRVRVEGRTVPELTGLELRLLCCLYGRRSQVCTRDEIIYAVYGDEEVAADGVSESRLDTLVARLRDKIEPDRSRPRYIITVRGRGFKLNIGQDNAR